MITEDIFLTIIKNLYIMITMNSNFLSAQIIIIFMMPGSKFASDYYLFDFIIDFLLAFILN